MGRREVASFHAAIFLLFAASASAATITGKITDAQNGNALASITVAAYTPAGILLLPTVNSDANGNYSLTVAASTYRLLVYDKTGKYPTTFYGNTATFESSATFSGDSFNINFSLRRGGTISGSVSNGFGLASGVTVAAYNPDGTRRSSTTTDGTGAYTLALPAGSYKVAAFDDAGTLWPEFYADQNSFSAGTLFNVVAGQNATVSFRLDLAARVIGGVVDPDTSAPLVNMFVGAYDTNGVLVTSTSSDFAGTFNLKMPAGTLRLVVSDPRQTYATTYYGGVNFDTASDFVMTPGATRSNVQVPMRRAGFVSGQVTDAAGAPLAVTVAAYGLDGTLRGSTTISIGAFNLMLAPGDYKLAAFDNQLVWATQFYSMQKLFSAATTVTITSGSVPSALRLLVLSHGARFAGTVIDAESTLLVAGITVAAYDANSNVMSHAVTNAGGAYAMVVPAGAYRVLAYDNALRYATAFAGASSYEESRMYAEVADMTETVNFNVTRGIRVSGTVRDSSGAPISGVDVSALDPRGNHAASTTTKNGTFDIVLLPNQYCLVVTDPSARYGAFSSAAINVTRETPVPSVAVTLSSRVRRRSAPH